MDILSNPAEAPRAAACGVLWGPGAKHPRLPD